MTPELESRLAQEAQEERYEPGSEPVHALRRGAELALQWLPMESCPNDVAILISRDNGEVEYITADDNDYDWQPYKGPRRRGVDRPNGWMTAPKAKALQNRNRAKQ